jgi:hypothetical protein
MRPPLLSLLPLLCVLAPGAPLAGDAPAPGDGPAAPPASVGAPDPSYLPELLAAARARSLGRDPEWLRLGHWRRGLFGGWKSEADGRGFFLASGGKTDPEAELEATLRGFFAQGDAAPAGAPLADPSLEHPQCRFPARFAWLAAALHVDLARLPPRDCPRFEAFWKKVSARSVTLVFSSYYLGNPASAFGHTFLRLGKEQTAATGDRLDLIDQGIDYAANADTHNAILYAAKGLLGFFRGEFSARPYFYKVREYVDFESRDLWEYELSFGPRELALLVGHLWELGQTWFDYYYLTENCSYHVLGALEAADPRLELLSHVHKVTLPADTVKALFANPGLVRAVRFRPSARTQLEARTRGLSAHELEGVGALARTGAWPPLEGLPKDAQARVLDAAVDLVDVRHGRDIVEGDRAADALRQNLLQQRSALGVPSPPLRIAPPSRGGPERGHGSMRLSLGGGASREDGALVLVQGRLALHDLGDPPAGFSPGTQLEFLKVGLSWSARNRALRLQEASLVEATSINALGGFDRRISWKLRAGATRVADAGCPRCVAGRLEVGGGPGLVLGRDRLAAALTADAELLAAPDLHGVAGSGFRPGVGPGLLVRLLAGERASLLASGAWRWLPWAVPHSTYDVSVEGRLHFGPASLALRLRRAPRAEEVGLMLLLYGG